jgi:hypothetical protein
MQAEEHSNLLIGCYSDGKDAPSLFYFDAQEKAAKSVLSEINPSYVIYHDHFYYVLA